MTYLLYALAAVLVALNVLDAVSTSRALAAGAVETNPLQAWLQAHLRAFWWAPKMAGILAFVALCVFTGPLWYVLAALAAADALYTWVVYHNFTAV